MVIALGKFNLNLANVKSLFSLFKYSFPKGFVAIVSPLNANEEL